MGAGASAGVGGSFTELNLSKADINKLYSHLSQEYEKKVLEFGTSPNSGGLQANTVLADSTQEDAEHCQSALATAVRENEEEVGSPRNVEVKSVTEAMLIPDSVTAADISKEASLPSLDSPMSTRAKKLYPVKEVQRKLIQLMIDDEPGILGMTVEVNPKVLDLLGDPTLENKAMQYVDKSKVTKKILAKFGAPCMIPEKALKRLGDEELSVAQVRAMQKAKNEEEDEIKRKRQAELDKIIAAKPAPETAVVRTQTRINEKAINKMGGGQDEGLMEHVRNQKTRDMTINSKTMALMGEAALISEKVAKRRGSDMHSDQRQRMLAERAKEEKRRAKVEAAKHKVVQETA